MLIKIMNTLKNGEHLSVSQLANRFNCSETVVKAALIQLEQLGYIKSPLNMMTQRNSKCKHCNGCAIIKTKNSTPKMWEENDDFIIW